MRSTGCGPKELGSVIMTKATNCSDPIKSPKGKIRAFHSIGSRSETDVDRRRLGRPSLPLVMGIAGPVILDLRS